HPDGRADSGGAHRRCGAVRFGDHVPDPVGNVRSGRLIDGVPEGGTRPPSGVDSVANARGTMRTSLRLTALLLTTTASPVIAQEGGLLAIDTGLMVWTVLIFLIVLAILYKMVFPHILGAVEAREAKIRDLLEEA